MHFDDLMIVLGEFGLYQRIRLFLLCLFATVVACHALNMVFVSPVPDFHCDVNNVNLSETPLEELSPTQRKSLLIPPGAQCRQYDVAESLAMLREAGAWSALYNTTEAAPGSGIVGLGWLKNRSRTVVACTNGYEYSGEIYGKTITSEFDLVCEREFWRSASKAVFFAGQLGGAVVFGQLSDRFGRRPMFFLACLMLLVAGTLVSLAPSMEVFLPIYFCQGSAYAGAFIIAYTLATEMVGPRYRVVAGFVKQSFYAFGLMVLPGIAYFVRDWRYLELAITLPVFLFGFCYWFLPESIRWLILNGRDEEADKILQAAASTNGVTLDAKVVTALKQDMAVTSSRQFYFVDCVRSWRMARLSLNVWFSWLVNSMVYYGLSLNTENLAGNPYLNFCVAGALEIPAFVICILLLNKVGRRWPLFLSMLVGGVACILSGCIPTEGSHVGASITVILAMLGKFAITASYATIHLMAAEIFATVIRSIGVGVASMSSMIGGILAPLILDLRSLWTPLPLVIFGSLSIVSAVLGLMLPETAGRQLAQLPEDMDYGTSCGDIFRFFSKRTKQNPGYEELTNGEKSPIRRSNCSTD